jgi:hypothetical protein
MIVYHHKLLTLQALFEYKYRLQSSKYYFNQSETPQLVVFWLRSLTFSIQSIIPIMITQIMKPINFECEAGSEIAIQMAT